MLEARYTLYYTDGREGSYPIFDCIYAVLEENHQDAVGTFSHSNYFIQYCRRPDTNEISEDVNNFDIKRGEMITFSDLEKQQITSTQLLQWTAPIDVAERYEQYGGEVNDVFYNCTLPWFGSMCQYKFDFDTPMLFGDIVNATFASRLNACRVLNNESCYPFLSSCNRGSTLICLDWREICDGKFDCLNGEDEQMCEQLEINECANNEYRCHYGGQCIPLSFLGDGRTNVDCLDASDETDANILHDIVMRRLNCHIIPTFLCEERICRHPHSFSCGDGECILLDVPDPQGSICFTRRRTEIPRTLLTSIDHVSNNTCQQALYCLLRVSNNETDSCSIKMPYKSNISHCEPLNVHCLSEWTAIPKKPILYGFFQLIYLTNRSNTAFQKNVLPDFVCFEPQRCPGLLSSISRFELNNGLACAHISNITTPKIVYTFDGVEFFFKDAVRRCLTIGTDLSCSHPSLFHCSQSLKCISYHRLVDGYLDCYFGEDESYAACQLNDSSRFICPFNSSKCLSMVAVGNLSPDCPRSEDELVGKERFSVQQPPFSYICNGHQELSSIMVNASDEKNCELWPCDTPYVRCNQRWNCLNGMDELDCPGSKCSSNEHECIINPKLKTSICLPMEHFFDKYIDECPRNLDQLRRIVYFNNQTQLNLKEYISWNITKCLIVDKICRDRHSLMANINDQACLYCKIRLTPLRNITLQLKNQEVLCDSFKTEDLLEIKPFSSTSRLGFFPFVSKRMISKYTPRIQKQTLTIDPLRSWYCNRGILVLSTANEISFNLPEYYKCLCSPSYFGSRCQWQNQRISLTLRLVARSATSSNIVFQVVIMLIDENGSIAPYHEQIQFMPFRDCNAKFHTYLLYPDRPKRLSTNYSIRIDIFHKMTLQYYGSWHLAIPFQFLPVNRIAVELFVPDIVNLKPCPLFCGNHGRCMRYINKESLYFCQCDAGYSGISCNISHTCRCSNDSLCIAPSICVCPLNKFGTRCYLKYSICQSTNNPCKHDALCIPHDDRISIQQFTCLCKYGFSGTTCEIDDQSIDIYFHETVIQEDSAVLIHFLRILDYRSNERMTTFRKIAYNQNMIKLYVHQPFHIILIELSNKTYYSVLVQEVLIESKNITTQVEINRRCHSINELMNTTLRNYHIYDRVKYYPLLCRQYSQVVCFHDEVYICFCDLDRFSNCFEFNHTVKYDCQGLNDCQNNGRCFENNGTCPTVSICVCEECFYGTKCQFSTNGFILTLDPILGYHIKPNESINRQPLIVKLTMVFVICMCCFGLVSSSLSMITFRLKKTRETGCGWYLWISSITSMCTLVVLQIKFWILYLSQNNIILNRSFLSFSCVITDPILKVLLTTTDWLNAFVAIERIFTVLTGAMFNKITSQRVAMKMIMILPLLIVLTYLHDPFYYRLIDDFDTDEKRTWCFVQHSSFFQKYNTVINLFHFVAPFSINVISSIVIVITTARNRSRLQPEILFGQHVHRQLQQYKQLFIAPCLLVLLALPRLIIPFIKGCMKSPRNPLVFAIGYFISFLPMTLHFYLFVMSSKQYKDEFNGAVRRIKKRLYNIFRQM